MDTKTNESTLELTSFEKEFKVQLNIPALYFSVFYILYIVFRFHVLS